jgi:hypothetical protein
MMEEFRARAPERLQAASILSDPKEPCARVAQEHELQRPWQTRSSWHSRDQPVAMKINVSRFIA